jgi:putative membrane protein
MFGLSLLADWDRGHMMNGNAGNGWWWLMGIGMLAVVIVTVVVVVWLVTRTAHPAGTAAPSDPNLRARQILGERLARGEIDPAEYQERLSHIT